MNLPFKVRDWPKEWQELWAERAAIMEFVGDCNTPTAERAAEAEIRKQAMEESHVNR